MIDPDIRDIIEPELMEGEELLWAGKPARSHISFIVKSILILSLTACLLTLLVARVAQWPPSYAIAPMLLVLGMLGFAAIAYAKTNRQVYGLTKQRGIIIDSVLKRRVISIDTKDLAQVSLLGNDAIGTLIFRRPEIDSFHFRISKMMGQCFHEINNPQEVKEIVFNQILLAPS